jgi:two-component system chemotaxis response regulator CheB
MKRASGPTGRFDAVVVGASAGGVTALRTLLRALPAGFRPPLLVVLHLPRDRPSLIVDVLGEHCALPVREACDKQRIEPGTVTFAPPDYHMLVEDETSVALSLDDPVLFSRPAIDPLFSTAAAVFSQRLLAIVLTGASSDGSHGLAAVRRAGGVAWVQCPDDADASLMPASALAHAGADAVLTLEEICQRMQSQA